MAEIMQWLAQGKLKPHVSHRFPLEKVPEVGGGWWLPVVEDRALWILAGEWATRAGTGGQVQAKGGGWKSANMAGAYSVAHGSGACCNLLACIAVRSFVYMVLRAPPHSGVQDAAHPQGHGQGAHHGFQRGGATVQVVKHPMVRGTSITRRAMYVERL